MKTEEKNNRPYFYLLLAIIFVPLLGLGFLKMNNWYSSHYFDFNVPVTMALHPLWEVKDKEIIVKEAIVSLPKEVDTPIKEYACKKWPQEYCLTMIATFQGES